MHIASNWPAAFVTALTVLLGPARAFAADVPLQCTTDRDGNWTITATAPTSVVCPGGGQCTAMDYQIVVNKGRTPSHVVFLVEHDLVVAAPTTAHFYAPCRGDKVTRLGTRDCSHKAIRIDDDDEINMQAFQLVGTGRKDVIGSSIVVKKGSVVEQCRIASLGTDKFDLNQQVRASEQIVFKGCTVTIPTDAATGEAGVAAITGENCVFVANAEPVGAGELLVNGQSVGTLSFGEGAISSGAASCTTKVISRKLYTWCTCADVNGDHIPDDPIPPCPAVLPS